jgi:hypothetical protein
MSYNQNPRNKIAGLTIGRLGPLIDSAFGPLVVRLWRIFDIVKAWALAMGF